MKSFLCKLLVLGIIFITVSTGLVSAMDSDGSFTFEFYNSVTSDNFTASGSKISIDINALLYDGTNSDEPIDPRNITNSQKKYTLTLYKASTNKKVGNTQTLTAYCSGQSFL